MGYGRMDISFRLRGVDENVIQAYIENQGKKDAG